MLRGARIPGRVGLSSVALEGGRVVSVGASRASIPAGGREADLEGRFLLPGLVNAHDVLDASTLPPLGRPPYRNLYEWIDDAARAGEEHKGAMRPSLADRLFLGGMRNLLAGTAAVVHHGADHRSLARDDFPVRVQRRYGFAHSPGRVAKLRQTYRTTDRRIPWFVRAAAGVDERARAEIAMLTEANVLRPNTVIVHGTALDAFDAPRLAAAGTGVVWCPEVDERLFAAQPPVVALLAAGVSLGLGSGSPGEGGRDLLSALLAARRASLVPDEEVLRLATAGGALVSRLPAGGAEEGAAADLLVVPSLDDLFAGSRSAVHLVVVKGRALFGLPELLNELEPGAGPLVVDGMPRALAAPLARRLRASRPPAGPRPRWLEGVVL